MPKYLVLLAGLIPTLTLANGEICGSWKNPIEPDMRILESQLTVESASQATAFLAKHGQQGNDDFEFGRENARKTLRGYELKRAAEHGGKAEVTEFCAWLTTQGFWND